MGFHRADSHDERRGDLLVGTAFCRQLGDLTLGGGEGSGQCGPSAAETFNVSTNVSSPPIGADRVEAIRGLHEHLARRPPLAQPPELTPSSAESPSLIE